MNPASQSSVRQFNIVLGRARSGIAEAQFHVGRFYHMGRGVDEDPIEAACWWLKAAQQGHAQAIRRLRALLRDDHGSELEDPEIGRWWFTLEFADAGAGDSEAQFLVGWMYWRGVGTRQDPTEAATWWRKSARQGHRAARLYLRRRKAEEGDLDEQFRLGRKFLRDTDAAVEEGEGLQWLIRASHGGHLDAMTELGRIRLTGPAGMRDSPEGVRLLLAAADRGHDLAVSEIDRLFPAIRPIMAEVGVDVDEAVRWLRRAAETGEAKAQYQLGRFFLEGSEVLQDPTQGYLWMRKAAAAGHVGAQHYLGCMYQEGHGVPRDENEGRRWLKLAAESGNTFAQRRLGWLGLQSENLPWK